MRLKYTLIRFYFTSFQQVVNTGNVRLENATISDASATLSCESLPKILEPGQSAVCSGSSVLHWAAIEAGGINTIST